MIRVPDRSLPTPELAELPTPLPLRRMAGPGIILAGLSIGSGEFVLWPRLTAEWGFAVFWAAWIGVTIQFFLNMEIERYTLATGESAVVGFLRLCRVFGPVFLVCGSLPWIWPGWATGGATLLVWEIGGSVTLYAIIGLVLCGLLLSLGPVIYRTLEWLQLALVSVIFVAVGSLGILVIRPEALRALLAGALQIGSIPEGIELPLLLGALAFAGAGGTINLAQSNYIKDKGYGMGRWIGRITSPLTGREESTQEIGLRFEGSAVNLDRWRLWWRRANVEHLLSFWALCILSLALLCLITYSLLGPDAPVEAGFGFIHAQAEALATRFGASARHAFLFAGMAVLFSTELALLDAVTRVLCDILQLWPRRAPERSLSRRYFMVLWTLIGFGILVLAVGVQQPLLLLVLSASLNALVMFLYSGLLLWLNLRSFRGPLRPGILRCLALGASLLFFGYFSLLTLHGQLGRLLG
ncbi:MAG: Nramp family divalent metal transporter [Myxococcota bacterium]